MFKKGKRSPATGLLREEKKAWRDIKKKKQGEAYLLSWQKNDLGNSGPRKQCKCGERFRVRNRNHTKKSKM